MHTYVLTSFVANAIFTVLVLLSIGVTKKATGTQAFALLTGTAWLIWAAVLLFGA